MKVGMEVKAISFICIFITDYQQRKMEEELV